MIAPRARRRGEHASLLLSLVACVVAGSACAPAAGALVMPRSWDDRYLDGVMDKTHTRPTLAVLPFTVSERVKAATDLRIGDILTTALFKTGRFDLVEREKLDEILKEQQLGKSGLVDENTAAKIGKLVGAGAVVFGVLSSATQQKIDKFAYDLIRTEVRIDARAVDTSTGRVTFTESADGASETKVVTDANGTVISGALDAQSEFAKAAALATIALGDKLGAEFPVIGYVVSVDDGGAGIVTDLGAEREIAARDELVILRPLERIQHPVTGAAMGWRKKILAVAEVVTVDRSSSTAHIVRRAEGTDAIRAGDVAVLRTPEPGANAR